MNSEVHHIISRKYTKFPPSRGKILKSTQKGGLSRYLEASELVRNTRRGRRLVGSRGRHLRQKHVVPGLSGLHDPCGALRSILRHPGPSATRTDRCAILRIVRDEGGHRISSTTYVGNAYRGHRISSTTYVGNAYRGHRISSTTYVGNGCPKPER